MLTLNQNNSIKKNVDHGNQKHRSFIGLAIMILFGLYSAKSLLDFFKFKIQDKPKTETTPILLDSNSNSEDICVRKGVFIIGNPRSLTTSLERYFIRRGDFEIIHEPVTRHKFSTKTPIVTSPYSREATSSEILALVNSEHATGNFLIKEMAWAIQDADFLDNLPPDIQVILMIRKPEQAILSHLVWHKDNERLEKELNTDFTSFHGPQQVMDYKIIKDIFDRLNTRTGLKPILIDADDLANNSAIIISKLCSSLGISFDSAYLHWESGEKRFWPYTDQTWQKDVTASTGFTPLRNMYRLSELSSSEQSELKPLIDQDEVIYQRLRAYRMQ